MRECERADAAVAGGVGVEQRQVEGAPHLDDAAARQVDREQAGDTHVARQVGVARVGRHRHRGRVHPTDLVGNSIAFKKGTKKGLNSEKGPGLC